VTWSSTISARTLAFAVQTEPIVVSEEARERLRELGYLAE
jgi:hypothetical protein